MIIISKYYLSELYKLVNQPTVWRTQTKNLLSFNLMYFIKNMKIKLMQTNIYVVII